MKQRWINRALSFGLWLRHKLPAGCVVCQLPTDTARALCSACHGTLPILHSACRQCAYPIDPLVAYPYCGTCLQKPEPHITVRIPYHYQGTISYLLTRLKFQGHVIHGHILGQLMAEWLAQHESTPPDQIIPVPLHWRRLCARGFNQSLELAKPVSKQLARPLARFLCCRARDTTSQSQLPLTARAANVKGAFQVRYPVSGLDVALVDDIYTTGHTTRSLAHQLLQQGARHVRIWCAARAV